MQLVSRPSRTFFAGLLVATILPFWLPPAVAGQTAAVQANRPPAISGQPKTSIGVDQWYSFRPTASDPDGDELKFSISNKPGWASFNPTTGRLMGTPRAGDTGSYQNILIRVSDGKVSSALPGFSIKVGSGSTSSGNRTPAISGQPKTSIGVDQWYSFRPTASDPDGDELTFSISNKPAWASFNPTTGRLMGTPRAGDTGSYQNILIRVSDGKVSSALPGFSIKVGSGSTSSGNRPPAISGQPKTSIGVDQWYSFRPTASDPDGDELTFSISNKPGWASFNPTTGRLMGTPRAGDTGSYQNILIRVSDGKVSSALPGFSIKVGSGSTSSGNRPPAISGQPKTSIAVDQWYSFRPTASDPDGDELTFSISNKPGWASFNPTTGRLTGTPRASDAATYSGVLIRVTDGKTTTSLAEFAIKVVSTSAAANGAPTISGQPKTSIAEGEYYSFAPTVYDPDGDKLTFSISNKPAWASFDSGSGRLSGTPKGTDAGTYGNIVISVSDAEASDSLPPFAIKVVATSAASNGPPTISGQPKTAIAEGEYYSFAPTVYDPDGDKLTFSISNKPAWASFNTGTGRLTGTPGAGEAGSYTNIVIRVTDGQATASLGAFEIVVAAASQSGSSVTLSWTAPTKNTDGSALKNLAGYKLYYGTASGTYSQNLTVSGATVTSAVIEDLGPSRWYFAIRAYNADGAESDFSAEVSKTVQ